MENKLAFAKDLIASCSVPQLTVDLDNTPLESGQFDEHRRLLEKQLPLLFDFIHQNDEWLFSNDDNETSLEVKARLLMLTCEIIAPDTLYKIRSARFLEVLDNFVQKNFHKILDSSNEVDENVLKLYTEYLKADVWKRHIGSVHGFLQFLKFKVAGGRVLAVKWAKFSLAVGLVLRECYLPTYKAMSTTIFQLIISHSDPAEIKYVNIPRVIFDALLNGLRAVDTLEDTKAVWSCLCDCLHLDDSVHDSWDWNIVDQMMENLLGSLKHTTKSEIITCQLSFIPRILLLNAANRREIEAFFGRDFASLSDEDFKNFRFECSKNNSYASYRWALYILKLFVAESHTFMGSAAMCEKMLQQFHICYLTSVYIIVVELMNVNLLKFFEQFSNILMEAVATHAKTPRVREMVRQIFITFIDHLEKSDLEDCTKDFQQYHKAFKQFVEEQCR